MKYLRNAKPRNTKRELADAVTSPVKKQFKRKFPSTSKVQVTGEDKSSHEKHLHLLKDQERKKCPDIDVVNGLMKRTFSMREKSSTSQLHFYKLDIYSFKDHMMA